MKVITINREYGAGGHTIGRGVAEKLGIEIYDKDIIRNTAKEIGLDEDLITAAEEKISKLDSFLRSITPVHYEQKDVIYEIESQVIKELASKGACVILGRCAGEVLRDSGIKTINVFLYSDEKNRMERVAELIGDSSPAAVHKAIKTVDQARHAYYAYYTDKDWGDFRNYDLMLDTGKLGTEKCIDIICMAAKD